jgi:hypothetical protein
MKFNIDAQQEKNIRALFYLLAGLGGLVAMMGYINERKHQAIKNTNEELEKEIKTIQLKLLKKKEVDENL